MVERKNLKSRPRRVFMLTGTIEKKKMEVAPMCLPTIAGSLSENDNEKQKLN